MLLVLLMVVALAAGKPVDYEQMLKEYAAEYPNKESDSPEYGERRFGDILVDDRASDELEVDPLNAIRNPNRKWPGGVLYYTVSSAYTSTQRNQIQAGINDLVTRTRYNGRNCIDIRPRTSQSDYVSIEKGSGCTSYVGRIRGRQQLSLANGCFSHGTIMHEFLHAFGFYHEQMRYDRDTHVYIDYSNIQPGLEHAFNKLSSSQITLLGTPYDYGSVMHYGAYAFARDRTRPTIIPTRSGVTIGQRTRLSALDIQRVQIHYGCRSAADSDYFKHLADLEEFI